MKLSTRKFSRSLMQNAKTKNTVKFWFGKLTAFFKIKFNLKLVVQFC